MNIKIKIIACALSILLPCWGIYTLHDIYTGGFSKKNVTNDFSRNTENWNTPSLTGNEQREIEAILNQKFTYLGMGHQSYAFISDDRLYVLKLFKFGKFKPYPITKTLDKIPLIHDYLETQEKRRLQRLEELFGAHELAYLLDRDNSGLIYIHLTPSKEFNKKIALKDRLGLSHEIDLGNTAFILQKKAVIAKTFLGDLLTQGNSNAVKEHIRKLFDMYMIEYNRQLFDGDHNVMINTGFIVNSEAVIPIRIDVGKLRINEQMTHQQIQKTDLLKVASMRIDRWLKKCYPQYRDEIAEDMQRKLEDIFHEKFFF